MSYVEYVRKHNLYRLYQIVMNFLDAEYDLRNADTGLLLTYIIREVMLRYDG